MFPKIADLGPITIHTYGLLLALAFIAGIWLASANARREGLNPDSIWNMGLIILTFCLVIIGTFLTRAGLVSSVHAFAQSDVGAYFLVFTTLVLALSLALLFRRLGDLRGEEQVDTLWSREATFLGNNLVFVGPLFGVFWGTLFPLFSEIVTGQRATVRAPYFVAVVGPLLWVAVVLMAVAPLVGWRRADPGRPTHPKSP